MDIMSISSNINPHRTFQMLYVYCITLQRYINFNRLYLRTHETLLSLISFLQQSLENGTLQDKMTFEEIIEVTESVDGFYKFQRRNFSLVERHYNYFKLIMYSNPSDLEEIFPDIAYNLNELLVTARKETEDVLREIQGITYLCRNLLSTGNR